MRSTKQAGAAVIPGGNYDETGKESASLMAAVFSCLRPRNPDKVADFIRRILFLVIKKVTPPLWLPALFAGLLSSCGSGGKVEIVTPPQNLGPLEITTQRLPQGTVGQPYSAPLAAQGGARPYTWSVPFAELPPGLTLNPTSGLVTGTPTQAANYSITVRVVDSTLVQQQSAMALLGATVQVPPLTITNEGVPNGVTGQAYSVQLIASGGTPPYTWSVIEGLLPPDLSLDPFTGVLSGVPALVGDYSFTIEVADSATPAAVARLSVASPSVRKMSGN